MTISDVAADASARTDSPPAPSGAPGGRAGTDHRRALLLGLLAAGASLRMFQYVANRSLWLDESLLVSSILNRPVAGLFEPLDYGQTAPAGFLVLVKLATLLLGTSEYVLRLVPLLAGLTALFAVVPLARRYLSRNAVPVAVALFALAPYLIYFASEVKQYSVDVLVSVVVLALACDMGSAETMDGRQAFRFIGVGVVGLWLSQPSVFMLAGTGLVLGFRALRAGAWPNVRMLAAAAAAWALSFAGSYAISRQGLADPAYMAAFWQSGFMPLTPGTPAEWAWLPLAVARFFREPLGAMGQDASGLTTAQGAAGLVAFIAGGFWMAKERDWRLALLIAPVLLVLLASALRLYPFGARWLTSGRVLIFLIPSFVLLMAEGAEQIRRRLGRVAAPVVFTLLLASMLAPSVTYAAVMVPQVRAEMKPLLGYANAHRRPGDLLYVYYYGRSSFEYYAPRYGWDRSNTVFGICSRLQPARYLADLERLRGQPRVWILFVDGFGAENFPESLLMLNYLEHMGTQLDNRVSHGVSIYLYDLRKSQASTEPFDASDVPVFPDTMVAMDCRGPWAPPPSAS